MGINQHAELPYALMFHHFTDHRHVAGQGAITAERFEAMLHNFGLERIVGPQEWMQRSAKNSLKPGMTAITFDDALRCQLDVALPVLDKLGLKSFWFVYSSVLEGNIERLEVYRYFRTVQFDSVDEFYAAFDDAVARSKHTDCVARGLIGFDPDSYLKPFPFYSTADRRFRFVRDHCLGQAAYYDVMDQMIAQAGVDVEKLRTLLWIDEEDVARLHREGHVIGLHTTSHPTAVADLPVAEQQREYAHNSAHLAGLIGERPTTVAHPCNSYSAETLEILRGLGVTLGFCSNRGHVPGRGALEMAREDHANLP